MIFFIILLSLCAIFLLALAFGSSLLLWYESLNKPEAGLPAPRPGPLTCPAVYLECLASFLLCAALLPFGRLACRAPTRPLAGEKPELPPLILIHGLYNNASSWFYLGAYLERRGFRVSTFCYPTRGSTPESIAAGLEEHVRRVESLAAGKKPIFICHSLGGLIARLWLMQAANRARAGGVITLGTPHGGSKAAHLAFSRLAATLRPGSAFLESMRKAPCLAPLPCVSLASPTDGAVFPAAALLPPEGWSLQTTKAMGHFSMLYRPSVAQSIIREIGTMLSVPSRS